MVLAYDLGFVVPTCRVEQCFPLTFEPIHIRNVLDCIDDLCVGSSGQCSVIQESSGDTNSC